MQTAGCRAPLLVAAAALLAAAFPPGGKVVYSTGTETFVTSLDIWQPKRIAGLYYAHWSPDGKMICGWLRNGTPASGTVVVMKADGSGKVDVASTSPVNSYAYRSEWAVRGKWGYEVVYPADRYTIKSTEIEFDGNTISVGATRTVLNVAGIVSGSSGNDGVNGFAFINGNHLFVRVSRFGWLFTPPDFTTVIDKTNYLKYRSSFVPQTCQSSLSPDGKMVQYLENTDQQYWWPGQKGPHKGFVTAQWTELGQTQSPIQLKTYTLYNTPDESFGERTIQGCKWSNHPDHLILVEQNAPRNIWVVNLMSKTWTKLNPSGDPGALNCDLYFDPATNLIQRGTATRHETINAAVARQLFGLDGKKLRPANRNHGIEIVRAANLIEVKHGSK